MIIRPLALAQFIFSRELVAGCLSRSIPVLAQADGAALTDGTLDEILLAVLRLRAAGIAHGTLGGDTII